MPQRHISWEGEEIKLEIEAIDLSIRSRHWDLFRVQLSDGSWVKLRPGQVKDLQRSEPQYFKRIEVATITGTDSRLVYLTSSGMRKRIGVVERPTRNSGAIEPNGSTHKSPSAAEGLTGFPDGTWHTHSAPLRPLHSIDTLPLQCVTLESKGFSACNYHSTSCSSRCGKLFRCSVALSDH